MSFVDICCNCSYRSEFCNVKYHTGIRFTQWVAFLPFLQIIRGPVPFIDLLNPEICTWKISFPVFYTCSFLFLCVGHSHFDDSPVFLHQIINHSSHFPWNSFIISQLFFFSDSFHHISPILLRFVASCLFLAIVFPSYFTHFVLYSLHCIPGIFHNIPVFLRTILAITIVVISVQSFFLNVPVFLYFFFPFLHLFWPPCFWISVYGVFHTGALPMCCSITSYFVLFVLCICWVLLFILLAGLPLCNVLLSCTSCLCSIPLPFVQIPCMFYLPPHARARAHKCCTVNFFVTAICLWISPQFLFLLKIL